MIPFGTMGISNRSWTTEAFVVCPHQEPDRWRKAKARSLCFDNCNAGIKLRFGVGLVGRRGCGRGREAVGHGGLGDLLAECHLPGWGVQQLARI